MRAMILAAGKGTRMGALTKDAPKALLPVAGKPLIEHAILLLQRAGIKEIVINVSYYAEHIKTYLQNGVAYQVNICYSEEQEPLETGGGIIQALPLLGPEPFVVMSSDIITNFPIQTLQLKPNQLAHLVMVDNPTYHANGDFALQHHQISFAQPKLTYGNIGIFHPALFKDFPSGYLRMRHILEPAIHAGKVTGEYYAGQWYNIGTPQDIHNCIPSN